LTASGDLVTTAQRTAPPAQPELARAAPTEFVICDYSIEEAFRDLKSSRFGLSFEQSRTGDLERLQLLLLIATLALRYLRAGALVAR
jgi:hypothetical protein